MVRLHSIVDLCIMHLKVNPCRPGEIRLHTDIVLVTYNSTNLTNNAIAPDYQFDATSPWAYAVDPSTAEFKFAEPDGSLPSPIFQEGRPPVSITVSACRIEWALAGDTFVDVPPQNATCVGEEEKITLTPYGVSPCVRPLLLLALNLSCAGDQAED